MGDFISDTLGTKNNYQAGAPPITQMDYAPTMQYENQNRQNLVNQQNAYGQTLQAQINGQGPNPALAQLHQTTDQNQKQAAGFAASQKGLNPALAARMAAQGGAQANQQAAGQSATLRAQQQLGAQSQLGSLYGQMGNQQYQNLGLANQALAQQNNAVNTGYLGAQGINARVSAGNQQQAGNLVGGLFNAGGAAAGLFAHGGMVGGYSKGGSAGPRSFAAQYLKSGLSLKSGGPVQGKAPVAGDSVKNDTVPAMLSPKEIVLPRSVTLDKNAPDKAAAFVEAVLSRKKLEKKK